MSELFLRTLSQGLQAFMPVAVCLAWVRRYNRGDVETAICRGAVLALPATLAVGYLFQRSAAQAQWEAVLAGMAACLTIFFGRNVWRRLPSQPNVRTKIDVRWQVLLAAAIIAIIVRQSMEIHVVFMAAAFAVRSSDAVTAICSGGLLALGLAWAWTLGSRRCTNGPLFSATSAFTAVFLVQTVFYAVHEAAEAAWLPWSDLLHVATEPYGPDGRYGPYISHLLIAAPLAAAVLSLIGSRMTRRHPRPVDWNDSRRRTWLATATVMGVACLALIAATATSGSESHDLQAAASARPEGPPFAAGPVLIFRQTAATQEESRLTTSTLTPPGADRKSVAVTCQRVSFAAGRGICLQAERRLFNRYSAVLFDSELRPLQSLKLDGIPSRTRISADGRVGAITVFVTGHGYTASFSTKTTLIDMASGDVVVDDLEQFATWRDGVRFQAVDFNFWGVTFARDSNTFYATLMTAGKTFLVKGDLGLRKFTVLGENIECPSLSPNNQLIAFKKRVGPQLAPWRLYVLDLASMTERPITAETRSVDDQVEWLDDSSVLYGMGRSSQSAIRDVWISPINGSGPARVFLSEADSPIIAR
jgi:hypothetical protein